VTSCKGTAIMGNILMAFATVAVAVQILILTAVSPAVAISADLAKKCQEMAIKAHPPQRTGNKPFAQAERDFFSACVAKNGQMQDNAPASPAPAKPN